MDAGFSESVLEKEAATEALTLWLGEDYDGCLQTLQRLESTSDKSVKTSHHVSILSYYNDFITAEELVQQLAALASDYQRRQSEPAVISCKAGNGTCMDPRMQLDEEDMAVSKLNMALVLYNCQQYEAAAEQLLPLYQNLDSLYEGAALHVVLLLIDVHLALRQPVQAAATLATLKKVVGPLTARFTLPACGATQHLTAAATNIGSSSATPSATTIGSSSATPSATTIGGSRATPSATPSATTIGSSSATPSATSAAAAASKGVTTGQGGAGAGTGSGAGAGAAGGACDLHAATGVKLPCVSRWNSEPMQVARSLLSQQGLTAPVAPDVQQLLRHYSARVALLHRCPSAVDDQGCTAVPQGSPCPQEQCSTCDVQQSCMHTMTLGELQLLSGSSDAACRTMLAFLDQGAGQLPPAFQAGGAQGGAGQAPPPLDLNYSTILRAILRPTQATTTTADAAPSQQLPQAATSGYSACHRPMVLNNLGVALHHSEKHQLASLCFSQALLCTDGPGKPVAARANTTHPVNGSTTAPCGTSSQPRPSQATSSGGQATSPSMTAVGGGGVFSGQSPLQDGALLYNLAVQHLLLGNFSAALPTFRRAAQIGFWSQPLVMLRTAESALGLFKQRTCEEEREGGKQSFRVAGGGPKGQQQADECRVDGDVSSEELLVEAVEVLGTACFLLEAMQRLLTDEEAEATGAAAAAASPPAATSTYVDARLMSPGCLAWREKECMQLRQAILCNLAYAHLLRQDHVAALEAAQQLLAQPNLAPRQRCLGASYAAEALCEVGRQEEAAQLLATQISILPEEDSSVQCSTTAANAVHSTYFNLASLLAGEGQLDGAGRLARKAQELCPGLPETRLLLVWIELKSGNTDGALLLLRDQQQ